ncbi:unnamed protein product [Rhizoctonia solani]|uniref:Zn(2)-C6 fungal-type domain-containing protein n=1 Tax=Rhizoctonia solani TaxID=456999 RepID=A0A8H3H0U1_9AGAM|nr:unnamed protein product [Rhizoctonia solani]
MAFRSRPGPLGTSCLTCKRRHKKCDLRQPVCKRCEVGRFKCEGYGHNKRQEARNPQPDGSRPPGAFEHDGPSHSTFSESGLNRITMGTSLISREQPEDTTNSSPPESFTPLDFNDGRGNSAPLGHDNISAFVNKQGSRVEDYLRLLITRSTSDASTNPMSIIRKIINLQAQSPYSPIDPMKTFFSYPWFVDYILERSDTYMDQWYFRPVNFPRKRSREDVVSRLRTSPISRWVSLVAMSIFEASFVGDISQHSLHNTWIGYIEGCLMRELSRDLTPYNIQERRKNWIHVAVLKTMIDHTSNTYQVLRNMTPIFLQSVFSEPKFWSKDCDPTYIPLSNILGSESPEISYFALIDCTYAMATGLPQQVEYDTTAYALPIIPPTQPNAAASHQWSLSSPSVFQLVLADINACRDKSPAARDWKDIEKQLLTWQSQPAEYEFTKPWMKLAWYAVQESWRLALLVYLYMAVCGASSDDLRIQPYVDQILQVVGTIKKRDSSDVKLSLFVQYLMVGICARSETHRKIARDKLSAPNESRLWLLRVSDFVPVLDHLWYGAAAAGRSVYWTDYMRSREAMLPIES